MHLGFKVSNFEVPTRGQPVTPVDGLMFILWISSWMPPPIVAPGDTGALVPHLSAWCLTEHGALCTCIDIFTLNPECVTAGQN